MGTIWIGIETISIDSNGETKATGMVEATKSRRTIKTNNDDSLLGENGQSVIKRI